MSEIGRIAIYGGASKKLLKTITVETCETGPLMNFLQSKGIPIASSCSGDGVCQKCTIILNQALVLACQVKMEDLFNHSSVVAVEVAYL